MPPPLTTATSRRPPLEEAMERQLLMGALACVQFEPAAPLITPVDVKMPPPLTTAASRVPSPEEAMDHQLAPGASDGAHVTPPSVEV